MLWKRQFFELGDEEKDIKLRSLYLFTAQFTSMCKVSFTCFFSEQSVGRMTFMSFTQYAHSTCTLSLACILVAFIKFLKNALSICENSHNMMGQKHVQIMLTIIVFVLHEFAVLNQS